VNDTENRCSCWLNPGFLLTRNVAYFMSPVMVDFVHQIAHGLHSFDPVIQSATTHIEDSAMAEKTIKGMHKGDLVNLLDETIDRINKIHEVHEQILQIEQFVANNASVRAMQDMQGQAATMLDEIQGFRRELLEGDGSMVNAMVQFNGEIDERKRAWQKTDEELDELECNLLGYTKENAAGEEVHHPGLYEKIVQKFKEYEEKHDDLYSKIETELMAGATTVGLAKAFGDKASEYKSARVRWQSWLILALILPIVYFVFIFSAPELSVENLLVSFVKHVSASGFFVWLVMVIGHRRAENKKLEESYTHKAVMAKSFTGYKKSIGELDADHSRLLAKLMDNLLDAIQKDASNFLTSKGENHPLGDASTQSSDAR